MIQLGSWNPALRPDNSPKEHSFLSLADSSAAPLSAKFSMPSRNVHSPTPPLPSSASEDSPAESTHAALSPDPSHSVLAGARDIDSQIAQPSSPDEPTETSKNMPSDDISAPVHQPVQPSQAESPSTEQETTKEPVPSEGFPWGKDDNADSAQGISRSTTDPFDGFDMTDRTNSFPNSDHSKNKNLDSHEGGYPENAINQEATHQPFAVGRSVYPNSDAQNDFLPWSATSIDEDPSGQFFNQLNTQTKPIYTPLEAESRYEEGMPLDNTEPASPTDNNQADSIDAIFREDEPVDDADLFASESGMPLFTRKSTSQVLDSLHSDQPQTAAASSNDATPIPNRAELNDNRINEEPLADKEVPEEDLAERWKAVLDDDDLLIDDDLDALHTAQGSPPNGTSEDSSANYLSEYAQDSPVPTQQPPRVNPYTPHQPSSSTVISGLPGPDYGLLNANATAGAFSPQVQQHSIGPNPNMPESFSNQAKAGYQSPYDLPMEIIRPKHRTSQPTVSQPLPASTTSIQPPPRKSSMTATRPSSSSSAYAPLKPTPPPLSRSETEKAQSSNFFEELPAVSRVRPSTASKYAPPQTATQPVAPPPSNHMAPNVPTAGLARVSSEQFQLQKPERLDPYSSVPVAPGPTVSGPSSHYSPKPPTLHSGFKPASSPRYSPAPPLSSGPSLSKYASQLPAGYPPSTILPFQPRTSSPLAQQENVSRQYPSTAHQPAEFAPTSFPAPSSFQPPDQTLSPPGIGRSQTMPSNQHLPYVGNGTRPGSQFTGHVGPQRSPPVRNTYEPVSSHTQITTMPSYPQPPPTSVPHQQYPEQQPRPPRRSQTKSPSRLQYEPLLSSVPEPFQRPASVHNPVTSLQPQVHQAIKETPSTELDFIYPTDGQELDPLQRWKGAPIFKFGFGGVIASSFPKRTPRYATGQLVPKIKPSPGEIKVRSMGDTFSQREPTVKFPGPLRVKSKKKDVISWLSSMISGFENDSTSLNKSSPQQHDETILLWKIIRVMVEHDGLLAGNPDVENSVRSILSPLPKKASASSEAPVFHPQLSSVYENISGEAQSEPMNVDGMETIRRCLLAGEREKAVWGAVDRRLWGHAMLISSTIDKSVWKQVMQEFVRREVKAVGNNTEPMATLYEIFAGNLEESVDELVPPSARAGLQMVSKIGGPGHAKNALAGLDKWQETLCLILSNRSPNDHVALLSLSRLLSAYGRIEASHICALFAKSASVPLVFSGPDDPQSQIVLLGTDHRRYPFTFANDKNSVLLTEVYEFALSILSGSTTSIAPHFQAFKLQYALSLAENGNKAEAQQYCDSIGAILKSTTKPSPYYNQRFLFELDELTNRLRQSPTGGSSSWMSKPSMEKVSGSILAKFNSFVAGDDSDGGSTGSGKAGDVDIGPFAKMVGTPPISRSPSVHDAYAAFGIGQPTTTTMHTTSRYAPGNQYAPYSSPDQHRGRGSLDSQRSPPSTSHSYPRGAASRELNRGMENDYHPIAQQNVYSPPSVQARGSTPLQQPAYAHLAPVQEMQSSQGIEHADREQPIHFGGYQPTLHRQSTIEQEIGSSATENQSYEPPAGTTGYEPPSYEPGPVNTDESDQDNPKTSFMDDDDDDLAARNEAIRKAAEKERKDREADEAFRKAAEEDAKKPITEKKGWFSWWGKKDPNASSPGPIRAKLGEENSFYYDKELKRWVNKKDPDSATTTTHSTPPPPKGPAPPSRSASATNGIPPLGNNILTSGSALTLAPPPNPSSGPPSQAGDSSPRNLSPGIPSLAPPSSASPMPRSVSAGLPSRPGTALSNASSIDDLLGAPQARKGNTVRGKKRGRGYVDVMTK
ncbi:COPII coat assembly protein SEC16 [Blastomyces dermatitidis ER-3]|uniref:Protein transport protein sec16 n=1 Tax=Ajellomyces dermatitidis (strain ER-3 / ATCC MYA-2586) TaxID=559297 RepID=A0ABP2F3V9_AJEDR|nr:COPII coat assembly protein SEC16 [Blastomyces dermatitidis ER-3]EEQ91606.1 COPII coat assembly protein SEC16 [Blastomyces dermatitidis ER-3]